ncbi:RNA polymerase II-associated protein, partial [Pholiota molesta]
NETPLPMIVDAECGMPLDLGKWECCLNPDLHNLPQLDPRDAALLLDPSSSTGAYATSGISQAGSSSHASTPLGNVTWLRKTEYISREGVQRSGMAEQKHVKRATARYRKLLHLMQRNFSLETLQHPNKPNVTAVESYPILPDADIWANQYDLFRFSERPGDRPIDVDDPRLDCAILRPMKTEHDSFLAFYLTETDDAAIAFKETRFGQAPYEVPENEEETTFHFVRDYETVKVEQEVPNEFLLVLSDGDPPVDVDDLDAELKPRREKGAYYKNIERKMHLKKKRVNDEREEALAEVTDPMYLMRDADGEMDDTAGNPAIGSIDVVSES